MHKEGDAPLIAVIGSTGSGKTALAEAIALQVGGELVSCDAKQAYRGMDIGTNKEKDLGVAQHLLDIKNPGERLTVAEYQGMAYQVIDSLQARGVQPILVGGSMLYAEAVMNGYVFDEAKKSNLQQPRYRVLKLGIDIDREVLKERLSARTGEWLKMGLVEEIQRLLQEGVAPEWLDACGQEYRFFTRYVQGEISLEEAVRLTNTSLHQYVKRQYTWWRRHSDIHWIGSQDEALQIVKRFLDR